MTDYFIDKNTNLIKELKERNIYGDFILAVKNYNSKKKSIHLPFEERDLGMLIRFNFVWKESPQGYDFWNNTYMSK